MDIFDVRDFLDETKTESSEQSDIQAFYANKTVFLTGASGFVGTLVLEKLLRTCQDLRRVYVLFRSSKKKCLQDRLVEYFNDPVFYRMKTENPTFYTKVTILEGDLVKDSLGLSPEDKQAVINDTHIIIHVAATVLFNESLNKAYDINVKGTKSLISFAEQMRHLQSFVYVSTAYSNCDRRHIKEKFYDPVFTDEETVTILQHSEEHEQAILLPHILERKPNTYTYTKSVSEDLIRRHSGHLPLVVVRPSIVMPTLSEPMPYWTRAQNSLLSLAGGVGLGVIRVTTYTREISLDLTPGDLTTNCILAAAWHRAVMPQCPQIYNCVGIDNPVKMRDWEATNTRALIESEEAIRLVVWKPHSFCVENEFSLFFLYYVLHILPGLVFSLVERYMNRKPMIMKIYRKFFFLNKTIRYFSLQEWSFANDNTKSLLGLLNTKDRELFNFDMKSVSWLEYCSVLYRCTAVYLFDSFVSYPKELYKEKMWFIDPMDKVIVWSSSVGLAYLGFFIVKSVLSILTSYLSSYQFW